MMSIKLSAIQLNSKPCVQKNIQAIARQLDLLITNNADDVEHIVVLPECCLFFGANDKAQLSLAQQSQKSQQSNELVDALANLAKQYKVTLIGGTIPLLTKSDKKFTNTCCAFDANGNILGQYDKIHLFDVQVNDNSKSYCESRYTQAGNEPCLVKTQQVNVGLSVCFDVRFPALYQTLRQLGADIITVPSAFTKVTGKAHWQTLLQARAIENQVYIIASGQEGLHENGRETWGHSMIISPWGEILASLEQGEGLISVAYQADDIAKVRSRMPLKHVFKTKI